ncbi:hypothetical protein SAMN04488243_14814 [Thermus arciformis]|uniref:Uncharacterized protein n=1 Tax=Thermus arciformis TaxID=482827 RepID=A0A1G7KPL1_9DEIN|nr:hypothetical protein [Thermus arciformis]SDF39188.1 hypothetical protein SAMN04488243_14814 [Thermus arciformis]
MSPSLSLPKASLEALKWGAVGLAAYAFYPAHLWLLALAVRWR